MAPIFLILGQHVLDLEREVLVLGLSIDQQPSAEARSKAAATTSQQNHQHASTTVRPATAAVAALCVAPADATAEAEVVVVSVVPPEDAAAQELARDVSLDISLTAATGTTSPGEFKIASSTPTVALTPLSPAFAPLATAPSFRCQALLPDDSRCPLARAERRWCLPHLEHHVVLHDEELAARKHWHEDTSLGLGYMRRAPADNVEAYNALQASLALRAMITWGLYAGDVDQGHADFERATVRNRANIGAHLHGCGSDGAGRLAISSFLVPFAALAAARESAPLALGARLATLTLDPAVARAHLPHPAATVSGLYAGTLATTALHETLVAAARGFGDLPPLVRRDKTYEEMSADERARFNEANGFGRDLTEEQKRAMDEWACHETPVETQGDDVSEREWTYGGVWEPEPPRGRVATALRSLGGGCVDAVRGLGCHLRFQWLTVPGRVRVAVARRRLARRR